MLGARILSDVSLPYVLARMDSMVMSGDIPGVSVASDSEDGRAMKDRLLDGTFENAEDSSSAYKENGEGGCRAGLGSASSCIFRTAAVRSTCERDSGGVSCVTGGKYGLWLDLMSRLCWKSSASKDSECEGSVARVAK